MVRVCDGGFCCSVGYSTKSDVSMLKNYYVIAYNGTQPGTWNWCFEACAIVSYDTVDEKYSMNESVVFDELSLITDGLSAERVYPSALGNNLHLIEQLNGKYVDDGGYQLDINTDGQPIVEAAIYGRCYDRDQQAR